MNINNFTGLCYNLIKLKNIKIKNTFNFKWYAKSNNILLYIRHKIIIRKLKKNAETVSEFRKMLLALSGKL